MIIEDLDLETRFKIYGYTKKVLRKYQKGIITGKLTADKFAENIISNGSISDIVDEKLTNEEDFKNSYIEYIDMLIKMQNSGVTTLKGCTFINVNASMSGQNSVIYNNNGIMNIENW